MKLSATEEYGLRCLLRIGRSPNGDSVTIPQISQAEGISNHNVAKLMRRLRRGGYVKSIRGQAGGYVLVRPPTQIVIGEVLALLGGRLYEDDFCSRYTGLKLRCTHSVDCSIRTLWSQLQYALDQVLEKTTLADLLPNDSKRVALGALK